MLSQVSLSGFKSISRSEPINLTGFSILCGSNSSGKSSFIQAILMLSQTFGSRFNQATMVLNGHLVRLGAFSDIRTHVEGEGERQGPIEIAFTITDPMIQYGLSNVKAIECKFTFGQPEVTDQTSSSEINFHPPINRIEIELQKIVDGDEKVEKFVLSAPVLDKNSVQSLPSPSKMLHEIEQCTISDIEEITKKYPGYRMLGCEGGAVIPNVLHLEYDHTRKMSAYVIGLISGSIALGESPLNDADQTSIIIPSSFFKTLKDFINAEFETMLDNVVQDLPKLFSEQAANQLKALFESEKSVKKPLQRHIVEMQIGFQSKIVDKFLSKKDPITLNEWIEFLNIRSEKERKALTALIDKYRNKLQDAWYQGSSAEVRQVQVPLGSIFYLANYLSNYFSRSIKYLGPLRNEPQAIYSSLGYTEPGQIGLKGEYTVAALHINRTKLVSYPSPIERKGEQLEFQIKKASLKEACRNWLEYLGVLVAYKTEDKGKIGYGISVKTVPGDHWQDLTHVGVGVSQVLPIVLMALLSKQDDLLVFEQPELHLHPKIQSRLCDFFIAMMSSGRQCLIETHSEYLINRLRRRIVQSRDEILRSSSSIFFVTKSEGLSQFSEVGVTRYGVISDWPEDFFDQTDMEIQKLLLEATLKRKEERRKEGTRECIQQS
ncbi:DUF3696 domain-containing protein [Paenalcaligenes sp. Me131]|uniref:DUF3696 domain-containing protein n=1 Tax=Paenalcaligenes sp. Me131 TaxID=3392636 RepID=UPI003D2E0884